MSETRRPKLDESAINDRKAQLALERYFHEQFGFRARKQTPDNGSDYLLELLDGTDFTHWHVTVQLKSVVNPTFIADGRLISYSFPVATLQYLLSSTPQAGLIVLYHVSEEKLYYDTIVGIYERLTREREFVDLDQEKISIHIPVTNQLGQLAVAQIHQHFLTVFRNAQLMQRSHGKKYGIPTVSLLGDKTFDINNLDDVKRALADSGQHWLSMDEVALVTSLMSKVPGADIERDKQLLLVKIALESRIGRVTDSTFYIRKCRRNFTLTDREVRYVRFSEVRNDFVNGKITAADFAEHCEQMLPLTAQLDSQVTLQLNIMYFRLAELELFERVPDHYIEQIESVEAKIDKIEGEAFRYLLKLWLVDIQGLVFSRILSNEVTEIEYKTSIGVHTPLEVRMIAASTFEALHQSFARSVARIEGYAKSTSNNTLFAHCQAVRMQFWLNEEFICISKKRPIAPADRKVYGIKLEHATFAMGVFRDEGQLQDAHEMATVILELLYIFEYAYGVTFPEIPKQTIDNNKKWLEKHLELGTGSTELKVPALIKRLFNVGPIVTSAPKKMPLNTKQLNHLADCLLASGKYPFAQRRYVIQELEADVLFYNRCTDGSLTLIKHKHDDERLYYTQPIRFILEKKATKIQSSPDTDLDRLLTSWGY